VKISKTLKTYILKEATKMIPRAGKVIQEKQFTTKFVEFPMVIDGVMDSLRYNVEEKRFDRITVYIATKGIGFQPMMSKNAVYCDEAEPIYIEIKNRE